MQIQDRAKGDESLEDESDMRKKKGIKDSLENYGIKTLEAKI